MNAEVVIIIDGVCSDEKDKSEKKPGTDETRWEHDGEYGPMKDYRSPRVGWSNWAADQLVRCKRSVEECIAQTNL